VSSCGTTPLHPIEQKTTKSEGSVNSKDEEKKDDFELGNERLTRAERLQQASFVNLMNFGNYDLQLNKLQKKAESLRKI